jgi:MauM/NapG family ferredoxin protein
MRKLRIASQSFFFSLFVISFILALYPFAYRFDSEWFLRLNPLTSLVVTVASRSMVPVLLIFGIAAVLVTILLGRVFCGFVCPLGAMLDFSDAFLFDKSRSEKRRPPLFAQRLKYVLLVIVLLAAIFGASFPLFMDPLSLLTRIFTILAYPFVKIVGADALVALRPMLVKMGFENSSTAAVGVPFFYGIATTIVLALGIFAGGFWDRRFWCNYICPSGALFGLISRWSLLNRGVNKDACGECGRCRRACPTRAIDEKKFERTNSAECIRCGVCTSLKDDCSAFRLGAPGAFEVRGADIARRNILSGALAGLALVPALRADALLKHDYSGRLIRPPGAVPEKLLSGRCIACGECMKACPTNAIQPCTFSDGFSRLYTPKIVPRIGGCEEKCYLCGHVCPTGALRKLTYEEKRFAKIGTAVINQHRCVAWAQNRECVVCDEICPYNAIETKVLPTTKGLAKVPVLYEELCMGCGMCEQQCPVFDLSAIIVYKFGENRRETGPYLNEFQKKTIIERRKKSDAADLGKALGGELPSGATAESDTAKAARAPLPPGFVQ